ncbi:NUDIX domain-containing protein [Arachnia propionica]|uniref:NUDIX domain-containing protein n=1 Tax=Arachnia propionica TaxID=1750 RepID=A0A3P1T7Y8_9ACTN|nr:NUDIX domain-containing protein [Arachnia propionica]RRD05450.1 NUDIX domain-containing protein [Arachnia propionica]
MRLCGFSRGSLVTSFVVEHGKHPDHTLFRQGWVLLRPLHTRLRDGEVEVDVEVRRCRPQDPAPTARFIHHEEPGSTETPVVHQRVGAYAIVVSPWGVLGTVNSSLTKAPGTWALPGGGLDPGEDPADGVRREVFEETGQHIRLGQLVAVQSDHWIGRAVNGVLEDFHALRLIHAATCETPSHPVLHDLGGSTERAGWVPVKMWRQRRWTSPAFEALSQHLERILAQSCWK